MNRPPLASLLLALACGGCARDAGPYPWLAPRAIEKLGFDEPDAPAPAPVVADPALDVEVAAADARLGKAAGDFARALVGVERAARAARGAAAGSEAWLTAQTALAELDGLRAEVSEVLSDLDDLAVKRATTLAPDYPALETMRGRARTELERQETAIARIGSGLAAT
ncbi:hypothetical protein [uncultured Sphingomonas sp.]|uniref:hypothetical protein n=1 Tax=uncultured Sphingomonas sp. TaxID=158754 RepID=UPI0035CB68CF